jgi:Ca2+-binding RTX toxin-like protein
VSRTLDANVENMVLIGAAIIGNGNDIDNLLTGNVLGNTLSGLAGNDTLDGGLGIDTLTGGLGNDTYVLDVRADVVVELANEGLDTIRTAVSRTIDANVENMVLVGVATIGNGNELDNLITGNALANTLNGAAGNDTLSGGLGNDTLLGGLGNDVFVFNTTLDTAANVDTIADFTAGDHLQLSASIFTSLGSAGTLAADHYFSGAGLSGSTSATQGAGVYYDTGTGSLYYDADGVGAAAGVKFAVVTGHPAIVASDLLVG